MSQCLLPILLHNLLQTMNMRLKDWNRKVKYMGEGWEYIVHLS